MNEQVAAILSSLVAGAALAAKDTAGKAIRDAYEGLKSRIKNRLGNNAMAQEVLEEYEKDPEIWQKPAEKMLHENNLHQDREIQALVQNLDTLLQKSQPGGIQVSGSGAVATNGGVAAGEGGNAAGRDNILGSRRWE